MNQWRNKMTRKGAHLYRYKGYKGANSSLNFPANIPSGPKFRGHEILKGVVKKKKIGKRYSL